MLEPSKPVTILHFKIFFLLWTSSDFYFLSSLGGIGKRGRLNFFFCD